MKLSLIKSSALTALIVLGIACGGPSQIVEFPDDGGSEPATDSCPPKADSGKPDTGSSDAAPPGDDAGEDATPPGKDSGGPADAGEDTGTGPGSDSGTGPGNDSGSGGGSDSGPVTDSGTGGDHDAGEPKDSGSEHDSGEPADSGSEHDSGTAHDSGTGGGKDSGTEPDSSVHIDGGVCCEDAYNACTCLCDSLPSCGNEKQQCVDQCECLLKLCEGEVTACCTL